MMKNTRCLFWVWIGLLGLASESYAQLPLVKLLSTGGTIASKYDPVKKGFVPALSGDDLIASNPDIPKIARVDIENIAQIGSPDMTPDVWIKLSRRANELLRDPAVAGVVITHGTDTLEETAYFLDLTITSPKPVVLVGAQRAASMTDTDGPRNLLDGIRVAVSPEAANKGVMIVMNGQINAAREATKTSTIDPGTFRSLEFGELGYADLDNTVRFYRAPLRRQSIPLPGGDAPLPRIEIVMHYAGADGTLIRSLLDQRPAVDGIVVAGTGLGHVSMPMFDAIAEARKRGVSVVITSRVYTGRIMPLYGEKGRGVSLQEIGCILGDNLTPQKARILLMLALTRTKEPSALQAIFAK